jgi:glutamine synthetase adenylyltransferase
MPSPKHPTLAATSDLLAKNNVRVAALLDQLPAWLDELVDAARYGDVATVQQIAQQLQRQSHVEGYLEIARLARAVRSQTNRSQELLPIKRSVIRLLSACGRLRKQSSRPSTRSRAVC